MVCLSKAFDTIDHKIVLDKLKYYGLEGHTLKLFNSHLTNRKQYVELGDINSKTLKISTGVPQGSILDISKFCEVFNCTALSLIQTTLLFQVR